MILPIVWYSDWNGSTALLVFYRVVLSRIMGNFKEIDKNEYIDENLDLFLIIYIVFTLFNCKVTILLESVSKEKSFLLLNSFFEKWVESIDWIEESELLIGLMHDPKMNSSVSSMGILEFGFDFLKHMKMEFLMFFICLWKRLRWISFLMNELHLKSLQLYKNLIKCTKLFETNSLQQKVWILILLAYITSN